MNTIDLLSSSGNKQVDDILCGTIGIYTTIFPERIRGFYLLNSYTDGTAVDLSDIDLLIMFKDQIEETEKDRAEFLGSSCGLLSPFRLDLSYHSEDNPIWDTVKLKISSVLVYGEDIRQSITLPPPHEYARECLHFAHKYLSNYLRGTERLIFPLSYPNPSGEFYGYDTIREPKWYPAGTAQGLKELINTISFIAKALVTFRSGQYVGTKREAIMLYRKYVNDEWSQYFEDIYEYGKIRWSYYVPQAKDERQLLQRLCRQTLLFENYFFSLYRNYLLDLIHQPDEACQLFAIKRLSEIIYPDTEIFLAVETIQRINTGELQSAAQKTLNTLLEIHSLTRQ